MKLTTDQIRGAWENGYLWYKLRDYQEPLYNTLRTALIDPKCYKYVCNCARRFGKSTVLMILAFEKCIREPGVDVRFTCDTQKHMKDILASVKKDILSDCPADLKPVYNKMEGKFYFRNGSTLHTYGADNGIGESQRGVNSHLCIIDEAGFIDDLKIVLEAIILPQLDTTNGKAILISNAPMTPAHPFKELVTEAKLNGYYSLFTMDDNTFYTPEKKKEIFDSRGGRNSTTVKREYFCEFVVDSSVVVIPEWDSKKYVKEFPKDGYYQFYHKYVCMDIGFKDFTAVLFGYYDFMNATLIVEDEVTMNGQALTTKTLATAVKEKEKELWDKQQPYSRRCDSNNPLWVNTLTNEEKLCFSAVNNKDPEGQINALRVKVEQGKVIVHPRCKMLIECLENVIWDKNRKALERHEKLGHFDHFMTLVYMSKNVDLVTNPIPPTYGLDRSTHMIHPEFIQDKSVNSNKQIFENMFKPPPRRK